MRLCLLTNSQKHLRGCFRANTSTSWLHRPHGAKDTREREPSSGLISLTLNKESNHGTPSTAQFVFLQASMVILLTCKVMGVTGVITVEILALLPQPRTASIYRKNTPFFGPLSTYYGASTCSVQRASFAIGSPKFCNWKPALSQ